MSSLTRSSIGWLKPNTRPGNFSSSSDMSSSSSALDEAFFQPSMGLSVTMTSLMLTPMGSVAISARPVLETTSSISSGKAATSRFSTCPACRVDSSSETLGSRRIWIASEPSSSRGMNSEPRNGTTPSAATTDRAAPVSTLRECTSVQASAGS